MKVGLLDTGLGIAHARIYHTHPQIREVVVFGRTPAKLQAFADEFGYATTTDLSSIYDDPAVDLIDVCLPTRLHAEYALRALAAGKHVLCELPLAATMADAQRIVDAAAASGRQVFVDMFGRFDPATEFLHAAIAQGRYGTLKTLTMELRSALLWEGYQIGLDSLARASWSWNATAAGHRSGSRSESCSASSPWPPRSGTTTRPDSQPYGP